jgi:hypothetical protein
LIYGKKEIKMKIKIKAVLASIGLNIGYVLVQILVVVAIYIYYSVKFGERVDVKEIDRMVDCKFNCTIFDFFYNYYISSNF